MFAAHVGHRAEQHGRDRDEELSRWIHGLGAAVQFGLGATGGPVTSAVVGPAVEPLAGRADPTRRHQRGEAAGAPPNGCAQDAADRLVYLWDRQLVERHVLDPELPDRPPRATGSCRRSTSCRRASPTSTPTIPIPITPRTTCARSSTPSTSPPAAPGSASTTRAVYDAIKAAQLTIYQELD